MTPFLRPQNGGEGRNSFQHEHQTEIDMAPCEVCGNNYDKSFEIILGGKSHTFDSFECAIQALLSMLRLSDHRPRRRESGTGFLLRTLCRADGKTELKDRA